MASKRRALKSSSGVGFGSTLAATSSSVSAAEAGVFSFDSGFTFEDPELFEESSSELLEVLEMVGAFGPVVAFVKLEVFELLGVWLLVPMLGLYLWE